MIGIIGAMPEEVEGLKDLMKKKKIAEKAGMEFVSGELCDKYVVVVQCGIGKVNAGVCAQILVDDYNVDALINVGVAGSLNNNIDVCDIVVSKKVIQHDFYCGDIEANKYEPGEIPGIGTKYFEADDLLIEKAERCAQRLNLGVKVHEGIVATGDQFINDAEKKKYLAEEFGADCCEMEGGAIAQVAYLNDVPFVILRAISDKADGKALITFDEFVQKAAEHSMLLVKEMVAAL